MEVGVAVGVAVGTTTLPVGAGLGVPLTLLSSTTEKTDVCATTIS